MVITNMKLVILLKPGYESHHNLTYWNNEHYYGFGAGAHGYVNGIRSSIMDPSKNI